MASSDACGAELARLSGPELVHRLRTSYRREDYKAAARVLDARDRALAEAKEGLDTLDGRLAEAEVALAEAKEGLDECDRKIAEAKEALGERDRKLAEAKEGLDARDRKLAKTEAALAEAKGVLHARDRKLAETEAELAATKEAMGARDSRLTQMLEGLTTALAEVGALRERYDALRGAYRGPVSEEARPSGAIAAPVPAPCGERRAEVVQEKGPDIIDLCSSDEEEPEGSLGVSRKRKAAASPCASDDEDDTLTISQLMKKKKREEAQPGADGEPKNADSVRASGDYLPEASLVIKEEAIEATAGACEERNVATFVQGRGNVRSGEDGGGMSSEIATPQPLGPAVGNGSLKNPSTANPAGPLGSDLPAMSVAIKKEAIEATVGGPDEPKVANFVQERGNGKSAKDVRVSRGPPPGFPARTRSQKNFSKVADVGARIAAKEGSVGIHLPKTPVIMERPEIRLGGYEGSEVAAFVHGRGNGESADNGVVSRVMFSSVPPGFDPSARSQKNLSKADHCGPRIAGKDDSLPGQEEDQARTPSLSARKIVESARAGAMSPMADNMVLGLEAIREQGKTNGRGHNAKVLPGTNAIEEQVRGGMVARATGEQDETEGLVHKRNVMPVSNAIGKQHGKLRSSQMGEISDGGRLQTSDKQLVSATLLPKTEPHTEPTSVEGLLPSAVTRKWEYEIDVFTSCIQNKELCMQAACVLYRQKKLMIQPTEGGQSGSSRLCKSDAHRVTKLVEFLLDGNVQGPLKRTAEELVKHDSTGLSFLETVVCQFYDQLFYIYKNKEDPYFR